MTYGGYPYGGVAYAGGDVALIPQTNTAPTLAVEVAFTTDPLATPAWVDITPDVRSWGTQRGRRRELERFQPGRATIVLANRERQYDSVYDAGPWFGNLKPMKRIRIRETFNGVTYPTFDGFVDRWQLDYPGTNRDATATVTATDAFKVFARTQLVSVFDLEMAADDPAFWWRLDESLALFLDGGALNSGSVGPAGDGTFLAGDPEGRSMIANHPNASLELTNDTVRPGSPVMGVTAPVAQINLLSRFTNGEAFTLSAWCRPVGTSTRMVIFEQRKTTATTWEVRLAWANAAGANLGNFEFRLWDRNVTVNAVSSAVDANPPEADYFVAVTAEPSGSDMLVSLYVNGTLVDSDTFTQNPTSTDVTISAIGNEDDADFNWSGRLSNVAIHTGALSATRIAAQYVAGTTPWVGDFPSGRIRRVLTEVGWPDGPLYLPGDWVQLDDGQTSFQAATTAGQTALEHIQKSAESEYAALVFIDRAGRVRLRDRTGVLAREPYPVTFGMETGKIGYRAFVPDDGDDTIRNRATISRLNGVARTSEDAGSIADFGTFQFTLDGLLMASDDVAGDYADFIVSEYKDQRRRIVSLAVGPAITGEENLVYPAMLGLELADSIEVENLPLGGGDTFAQTCVIEGIEHEGHPGGDRSCRLMLSPELLANTAEELLFTEASETLDTETGVPMEVD